VPIQAFYCNYSARPFDKVYNFGRFSDGDRCVFVARKLGAYSIKLAGFYFEDPDVNPIKKNKLKWAKKLMGIQEF
jgi:uncharacterized Rossmann fold enzyme